MAITNLSKYGNIELIIMRLLGYRKYKVIMHHRVIKTGYNKFTPKHLRVDRTPEERNTEFDINILDRNGEIIRVYKTVYTRDEVITCLNDIIEGINSAKEVA